MPRTYNKYTARKVLTTQWIDGEKLSQSTESDVGELVNVGVICYLKQVIIVATVHKFIHREFLSLSYYSCTTGTLVNNLVSDHVLYL